MDSKGVVVLHLETFKFGSTEQELGMLGLERNFGHLPPLFAETTIRRESTQGMEEFKSVPERAQCRLFDEVKINRIRDAKYLQLR